MTVAAASRLTRDFASTAQATNHTVSRPMTLPQVLVYSNGAFGRGEV